MRRQPAISHDSSLPTGAEKARQVRAMFDSISGKYDRVNKLISLGLDGHWRKLAVRRLGLPPGSLVIDIACGTGDFCNLLETIGYRAVGLDFSFGMLDSRTTPSPCAQADACHLPLPDSCADGITCGFALRNFAALGEVLSEMARVTKPGGRICLLDASVPSRALFRLGHSLYFNKLVPLIGAAISDRKAYSYLPKSVGYLPPPEGLRLMLSEAGFQVESHEFPTFGAVQLISAVMPVAN